jgi:hypothetical protein
MSDKTKPSPWERIIRAADRGTGLRLTAEEALMLSRDNAIVTRAELDQHERLTGEDLS